MMSENSYYKWNVQKGDYIRKNGDYDKLYHRGLKRDRIVRALTWVGAASVSLLVFMKILAYAAWK